MIFHRPYSVSTVRERNDKVIMARLYHRGRAGPTTTRLHRRIFISPIMYNTRSKPIICRSYLSSTLYACIAVGMYRLYRDIDATALKELLVANVWFWPSVFQSHPTCMMANHLLSPASHPRPFNLKSIAPRLICAIKSSIVQLVPQCGTIRKSCSMLGRHFSMAGPDSCKRAQVQVDPWSRLRSSRTQICLTVFHVDTIVFVLEASITVARRVRAS